MPDEPLKLSSAEFEQEFFDIVSNYVLRLKN